MKRKLSFSHPMIITMDLKNHPTILEFGADHGLNYLINYRAGYINIIENTIKKDEYGFIVRKNIITTIPFEEIDELIINGRKINLCQNNDII